MLRPFAHPVACCCVLLGVVAQSLKLVKLLVVASVCTQLYTVSFGCFGRVYSKLHCFFLFEGVAAITVQFTSLILIVFALNYSFM